jgi:hypothetical protein
MYEVVDFSLKGFGGQGIRGSNSIRVLMNKESRERIEIYDQSRRWQEQEGWRYSRITQILPIRSRLSDNLSENKAFI